MGMRMAAPDLPQFEFEWNPGNHKLYAISGEPAVAEMIVDGVTDPDRAQLLVKVWCNGYRARARELSSSNGAPRHYSMLAEGGHIGARMR
jgi:hypothetical protein